MIRTIPTDLLRAFVTVVDLKGFTRAGELLGRSQPAISLQIKRLQDQLGVQLFDRDLGTGALTEQGHMVAGFARRILALNDEMMTRLSARVTTRRLKIGMPNDCADFLVPRIFSSLELKSGDAPVEIVCDLSGPLLAGLKESRFDLVVARTEGGPAEGAFLTWREPMTWVGQADALPGPGADLRLLACGEGCTYRRAMLSTLAQAGRPFEIVYSAQSVSGLAAVLASGFGISAVAERALTPDMPVLDRAHGLPTLPDLTVGVYIADGPNRTEARAFAARLAMPFRASEADVA